MTLAHWVAAVALVALFGGVARSAPLSAYGELPSIERVSISPDGGKLALAVTNGEQRRIVIRQISPRKDLRILDAGSQKVRDISWAGDDHLTISTSTASYIPGVIAPLEEWYMAADLDLATGKQRPLLGGKGYFGDEAANMIFSLPTVRYVDGRPMVFVTGVEGTDSGAPFALFKIDPRTGIPTVDAPGLPHFSDFATGATSALAEAEYDGSTGRWTLRVWRGGHWDVVRRATFLENQPELVGAGRDGASMLVQFHEDSGYLLKELDLKGEQTATPLPLPDADDEFYDTMTSRLIGQAGLYGDDERYVFFDPHDQEVWKAIAAAYPGQRVGLVDYDAARDKYVVRVDSPSEGPAYALVDLANKHASWIGSEYLGLKSADISPVQAISFPARDGLEISGYLTTPQGKAEKALPLVVLVHGGPAARDEPGFDWWSQALASRGYAVLRVNYRGSDGLGWSLQAAGFGEWGRKMQTDLSDGVRYLAARGIVDPRRVCIAGASYGGYAALAGATLDAGVYRCAASIAGPSDLARMTKWDKAMGAGNWVQRYWARYMGALDKLDSISPARNADKVTIPILLIHGKDDTVVAYEQSQIMADALTKAGKPFQFVTLKSEDHWLSRGATRLEMLETLTAFLEKNNPPG